jgi:hypothetical protein
MLFREIRAVYAENLMKYMNTLWKQNVQLLNIKAGGIQ